MSGLNEGSVTDTKTATGDALDNRDGGVGQTLEDTAAEIGTLFDAACVYTDKEKRLWRMILESTRTAGKERYIASPLENRIFAGAAKQPQGAGRFATGLPFRPRTDGTREG